MSRLRTYENGVRDCVKMIHQRADEYDSLLDCDGVEMDLDFITATEESAAACRYLADDIQNELLQAIAPKTNQEAT